MAIESDWVVLPCKMFSKFCEATRRDSFKVMLSPVKFVFNSLKLVPVRIQVFGLKEVYIYIVKTRRGVMPVIHELAVFKQNIIQMSNNI